MTNLVGLKSENSHKFDIPQPTDLDAVEQIIVSVLLGK